MSNTDPTLAFIVWMVRLNDPNPDDAYCIGIYQNYNTAIMAGQSHTAFRGGKYIFSLSVARLKELHAYLASVATIYNGKEIVHLVGAFDTEELAHKAIETLYPNWEFDIQYLVLNTCTDFLSSSFTQTGGYFDR